MSPFRRNWEQYSFNNSEQQLKFEQEEDWETYEEETNNDEQEDLSLVLEDAQDALSRFISRESRRGEKRGHPTKKQRQAWQ